VIFLNKVKLAPKKEDEL